MDIAWCSGNTKHEAATAAFPVLERSWLNECIWVEDTGVVESRADIGKKAVAWLARRKVAAEKNFMLGSFEGCKYGVDLV